MDGQYSVLPGLPPQYAEQYNGLFAQRFLVAAADMTMRLASGWTAPGCVAQERDPDMTTVLGRPPLGGKPGPGVELRA